MNTEPKRNETGSVRQALRQAPAAFFAGMPA